MKARPHYVHISLLVVGLLSVATRAQQTDTILTNDRGEALKGFDPVAYFEMDTAARGDTNHVYEWAGVKWLFLSEEHKQMFVDNPGKYVPKYGGYCAYGVRFWRKVVTDPRAFSIVDDTLYINLNDRVRQRWEKHTARNIRKADRRWKRVKFHKRA